MGFKIYNQVDVPVDHSNHTGLSIYKAGFTGRSHSIARTGYVNREAHGDAIGLSGSSYYYDQSWDRSLLSSNDTALMLNRLRSKINGKLGTESSVGSSVFAEGKESVRMAVNALENSAAFIRAIRRKDITALKKAWRRSKRPTRAMKDAGGVWLSYSFGWKPLVTTISDAFRATGQDFDPVKVHASVSQDFGNTIRKSGYYFIETKSARQFVKAGFDVKVTNPNLWLLGRLDLVNPATWIWEAIPYSFFVDYFVNIGDIIQSLHSTVGLSLTNGWTTYVHSWDEEILRSNGKLWRRGNGSFITRSAPISLVHQPTFMQNPLTSSWQRGLNASSFIAQRLR